MSSGIKKTTIEGLAPAAGATNLQAPGASPAFQLDAARSLRMHPRLAIAAGAAVLLLVILFGLSRKPVYKAETLTYIEPLASKVVSDGSAPSYDPSRYDSYFQQQMETAQRPDILATAISQLPEGTWQHPGESMQSAVARLQASLKVERVTTSYQLSISLKDANPEVAAQVVNAVTRAYLEQGRKDEHALADQKLHLLGEERQRIQGMLDRDRAEQSALGVSLGVANPAALTGNQYDMQTAGVRSAVTGAQEAHDIAAAQMAALGGPSSAALQAAADEQIATDAGLNSMKSTINQRKAVLSSQMAGLTPSNPIYKQDQGEIADLDRSLDVMTAQLRERAERRLEDRMHADVTRTASVEGRLNAQLARQAATASGAAPKLQRATALAAEIDRLNARYAVVDDTMRELELESNGPGAAHLSLAAAVPVSPEPSRRQMILFAALPIGLLAGLFAAVLAHRRDPRVYTGRDVANVLGFHPIGVMPSPREVSGSVMEDYTLRLAAGLQSAYRSSAARTYVFTSASADIQTGEFVRSLQQMLGKLGFRAKVLDAASILKGRQGVAAAAEHAGGRPMELVRVRPGAGEGYASAEMERLKTEYDLLLIDAPPLLHSAETEYLVRNADATILIAECGVTIKSELFESAVLLQQLNVAGVGAVLQDFQMKYADPAFRASIAAVDRIHEERHQPVAEPTPVQEENESKDVSPIIVPIPDDNAEEAEAAEDAAIPVLESVPPLKTPAAAEAEQTSEQDDLSEPTSENPELPAGIAWTQTAMQEATDDTAQHGSEEASEEWHMKGDEKLSYGGEAPAAPEPGAEPERTAPMPSAEAAETAAERGRATAEGQPESVAKRDPGMRRVYRLEESPRDRQLRSESPGRRIIERRGERSFGAGPGSGGGSREMAHPQRLEKHYRLTPEGVGEEFEPERPRAREVFAEPSGHRIEQDIEIRQEVEMAEAEREDFAAAAHVSPEPEVFVPAHETESIPNREVEEVSERFQAPPRTEVLEPGFDEESRYDRGASVAVAEREAFAPAEPAENVADVEGSDEARGVEEFFAATAQPAESAAEPVSSRQELEDYEPIHVAESVARSVPERVRGDQDEVREALAEREGQSAARPDAAEPLPAFNDKREERIDLSEHRTGWSTTRSGSRSAAAPVEERLQPRSPGLTRRWQMLSRFDRPAVLEGQERESEELASSASETGPGSDVSGG